MGKVKFSMVRPAVAIATVVAAVGPLMSASLYGQAQGYEVLDRSLRSLRDAFNDDVGKVRALLLVSPT